MESEDFKRRLSAILSADVVGYSRLMGEDDDATVRTLTGHRGMISDLIKRYQGRVVDSPGDNLLAEFESVLHGVNCAVEILLNKRFRLNCCCVPTPKTATSSPALSWLISVSIWLNR